MAGEDGPEGAKKEQPVEDPRRKKLMDMGYDISILDADP